MLGEGEMGEWLANPPIALNCEFCDWNEFVLFGLNVDDEFVFEEVEWDPFSWEVDEEDDEEVDEEEDDEEDALVSFAWLDEPNVISL